MVRILIRAIWQTSRGGGGGRCYRGRLLAQERKLAREAVDLQEILVSDFVPAMERSQLTTASCSFSSCICRSAAVRGLG